MTAKLVPLASGQGPQQISKLADLTPAEVDAMTDKLLPPSVTSSIAKVIDQGNDPQRLGSIVDYRIDPDQFDRGQGEEAIRALEELSRLAHLPDILKELTRLRLKTGGPRQGATDMEFQIEIYAEELQIYPLDVVRDACRAWPKTKAGRWWPNWHELEELCEERFLKRKSLLNALYEHYGMSRHV